MANHVLVLIGLPGAGKTTVARRICDRLGARYYDIGYYRGSCATALEIAQDLAIAACKGDIVFECSGASDDFEEILHELGERKVSCFVVGLEIAQASALGRLASRVPYTVPKAGRGWAVHLDWTRTRLGMVPTDVDIDSEILSPEEVATIAIAAWKASLIAKHEEAIPQEVVTFSQLSKWQVCGSEYAYRYIYRTAPASELPPIVDIGYAAHEALAWLFMPGVKERALVDFLEAYDSKLAAIDRKAVNGMRAWGRELLSVFYSTYYIIDDAETLAVESSVAIPLTPTLSFAGRLDRLSLNSAGELEITEFKLRHTRRGSRPRYRKCCSPRLMRPPRCSVEKSRGRSSGCILWKKAVHSASY